MYLNAPTWHRDCKLSSSWADREKPKDEGETLTESYKQLCPSASLTSQQITNTFVPGIELTRFGFHVKFPRELPPL